MGLKGRCSNLVAGFSYLTLKSDQNGIESLVRLLVSFWRKPMLKSDQNGIESVRR